MVTYADLVNKSGTIYNKNTGVGYSSEANLAEALGLSVMPANWHLNPAITQDNNWTYTPAVAAPSAPPAPPVVPPSAPASAPVSASTSPVPPGSIAPVAQTRTLIDIANSRPDVLNTAKAQGGDPFTAGTKANTWLNDWWNSAGKNEYPGVTLVQPGSSGVSFNDTFGDEGNKIVDDSSSIDANKAADEAKKKEADAKMLADLQTQVTKLTFEEQVALTKKNLSSLGIDPETGGKITKPPLPSFESTGKSLMSEYGIEKIQSDMNSLDSQIADLQASMRQGMYNEEGKLKPMELIGTSQRELARQGQEALDTLTRAKAVLVDQYNTKVGLINTLMGWKGMDYQAAVDDYTSSFNEKMTFLQIVEGRMDRADKELNAQKDAASVNLTFMQNSMISSGKTWDDLDSTQQAMIYKLEVQAGIAPGTTQSFMNEKPDSEVLAQTTGYDASGNQVVTFIYKDKDGKPGVVETVKTGAIKEADAGILAPNSLDDLAKLGYRRVGSASGIGFDFYKDGKPITVEEIFKNTGVPLSTLLAGSNNPADEQKASGANLPIELDEASAQAMAGQIIDFSSESVGKEDWGNYGYRQKVYDMAKQAIESGGGLNLTPEQKAKILSIIKSKIDEQKGFLGRSVK